MPLFEVTISGAITTRDEDDELVCFEEQYTFVKQARDLITAMMAVQQKLDVLNEAIKKRETPRKSWFADGDEFSVTGIVQTDMIQFNDRWIKEYLEFGVVNHEEKDDD